MGTQLTIELYGLTCRDLLRFADALRACGVRPETGIEHIGPQEGRPPRLQVTLLDSAGERPSPAAPWHGPGPAQRPPVSGPPRMSASPVFGAPPFYSASPRRGGRSPDADWEVQVSFPGGAVGRRMDPDGFARWRSALSEAIGTEGLSEASRVALTEIQQMLDPRGPEGTGPW